MVSGKQVGIKAKIQGDTAGIITGGCADINAIFRVGIAIQGLQQAQNIRNGADITRGREIPGGDNGASNRLANLNITNGKGDGFSRLKLKSTIAIGQTAVRWCAVAHADHLAVEQNTRLALSHLQTEGIGSTALAITGGHLNIDCTQIATTGSTTKSAAGGIKL